MRKIKFINFNKQIILLIKLVFSVFWFSINFYEILTLLILGYVGKCKSVQHLTNKLANPKIAYNNSVGSLVEIFSFIFVNFNLID